MEVIGFVSGYSGLISKEYVKLEESSLSGILTLGGTILGASREKPFKVTNENDVKKPELMYSNYQELGLDCLVCIGGNGTMKTAVQLADMGLQEFQKQLIMTFGVLKLLSASILLWLLLPKPSTDCIQPPTRTNGQWLLK